MSRGLLVFAPCGTGKSHFIKRFKGHNSNPIVDGDTLLEEAGVYNRNYLWYEDYPKERAKIIRAIEKALKKGIHVFYSGNPLLWEPDYIVYPDPEVRKRQLRCRDEYVPTTIQFDREEEAYQTAIEEGIPSFGSFEELEPYLGS